MKKTLFSAMLLLAAAPAFASIAVHYPETEFQSPYGTFSVSIDKVCHVESDDTLKAVVQVEGYGEQMLSKPRTEPLFQEIWIVQTFSDGTQRAIGSQGYQIRSCQI